MAHYIALLAGRENLLFLVTGFSEIAVTNLFLIVCAPIRKRKKRQKKVVQDGEGGDKKSTEDASDGESRKSPPEVTGDGDDHSC